ncbi:iron complex outermembrane receptor protein [Inhella inkyongensis]|uniref:Iron complex outermembrane receptor protein n=1 Tax=Inhella inkyongensis TaxID=392593 RepID=A0A840SA87_9BURK|nr:TonB-dependent receptor [Inhella inkyongensis]MBB5205694.1 iron complex outermembrane receptor protein [Inhella inkyongensis]
MRQPTRLCAALAVAFGGLAAGQAFAQETKQQLERVEVTGSSIKRVAAEGALPLTIVTKEDIARTGATTVQDLVNLVPSNFGGAVANNNVGATGNASEANLRALGSKYTLVLLNGRRIANFAFGNSPVDLNSIPLAAVERVEILRDGASALYGADAVAGVINFIMRKDFQGVEIQAGLAKTANKGADGRNASIAAGFGDYDKQGFNLVLTGSYEHIDRLKAVQRPFANSGIRPELGVAQVSTRNGIPNLNFTDTRGNEYTGVNPLRYNGCNSPAFALANVGDPTQCATDYVKFIDLVPEQTRAAFSGRQIIKLNADHQLVLEYMHTRDRSQSFYSPAPYTEVVRFPFAIRPGTRFYPTAITLPKGMTLPAGYIMPNGSVLAADTVLGADMQVTPAGNLSGRWRTVAGGGRSDITETENDRFMIGANGSIGGWDYDAAVVMSKNKGEIYFGPGKFSYAKLQPLLDSGNINIFGPQDATSQALLDSALISGQRQQTAKSRSTEFDFRMSRELMATANGPWALGMGANYRQELIDQVSEPVLASGDEVGGDGAIPSVSSGRKVAGVWAETVYPVAKGFELTGAARYDKYKNDFGTSFNAFSPKASVKFQPMRELTLRGSVAKGYRAPTLYENLRPLSTSNNTASNWSDPIRCPNGVPINNTANPVEEVQDECNIQLAAGFSGNRNLKPEKSTQFALGLGFSPTPSMTFAVDYWNVDIKDPIVPKSEAQVLGSPVQNKDYIYRYDPRITDPAALGSLNNPIKGSQNPDLPIAYIYLPFENTAKTYASGVDFSAQFRFNAGEMGKFAVLYDSTLFVTHGYQYTGLAKTSDLGKFKDFGSAPRYRHAATLQWNMGKIGASLTNNYTAAYEDYTDSTLVGADYPLVRKVKANVTWDMQLTGEVMKGLGLTFGVKNLLDKDPPASRNSLYFQVGFDPTYGNPIGRQYYLNAKYSF